VPAGSVEGDQLRQQFHRTIMQVQGSASAELTEEAAKRGIVGTGSQQQ
jgi:hypothetical protein